MKVRAAFLTVFLGAFLALGATIAGVVMVKGLPTTKTLQGRLEGAENGFTGYLNSSKGKVVRGTEHDWDSCVDQHDQELKQVFELHDQLVIIIAYYDLTGGSDESADNFDKWLKEFEKKGKLWLDGMNRCYNSTQLPLKQEEI